MDDSRRLLFPAAGAGVGFTSSSPPENNNNHSNNSNVSAMLQLSKQEMREETGIESPEGEAEGSLGKKRRSSQSPEQEEMPQSHQMGSNYLLQSSSGSIPASHSSVPATFWMVSNGPAAGNNQPVGGSTGNGGGDPIWAIPSVGNYGNMYRNLGMTSGGGGGGSGIHFMNFGSPVALMGGNHHHNHQLGGNNVMNESNLGMLAALNAYRQIPASGVSESPAITGHGGGEQ